MVPRPKAGEARTGDDFKLKPKQSVNKEISVVSRVISDFRF